MVKEDALKMSVEEMSERESKRNNVILHGVAESTSSYTSERRTHDLEKLSLSDSIKAEKDIKFTHRIGEKRQQQEARPIKVGFNYLSKKESLLESARYLNEISDLRQISIGLTDLLNVSTITTSGCVKFSICLVAFSRSFLCKSSRT